MFRDCIVRFLVLLGVAVLVMTEGLGYFSLLARRPLIIAWLLSGGLLAIWARRRYGFLFSQPATRPRCGYEGAIVAIAGIAAIIALTAMMSPRTARMRWRINAARRVLETGRSVAFSASYFSQIMLPPLQSTSCCTPASCRAAIAS
jgi:hypothetical protein